MTALAERKPDIHATTLAPSRTGCFVSQGSYTSRLRVAALSDSPEDQPCAYPQGTFWQFLVAHEIAHSLLSGWLGIQATGSWDRCRPPAPALNWDVGEWDSTTRVQSTVDHLAGIRAELSLNTSETARVLGVGRPTVYSWMRGEAVPQEANRRRLLQVAGFARRWSKMVPLPMGALKDAALPGGSTLVELISADELNEEKVNEALDALARHLGKSQKATLTEGRAKPIHELAREKSFSKVEGATRQETIREVATRKGRD